MSKKMLMMVCALLIGEMEGRGAHVTNVDDSSVAMAGYQSSKKKVMMTKIYKHSSDLQDRLVLYFSQTPECLYIPDRMVGLNDNKPCVNDKGMVEMRYFFPVSMKQSAINKYISKAQMAHNGEYSVAMDYDKNKHGFVVTIAFDKDKVGFQYETFSAITGEPALSFAFFKRNALHSMNLQKNIFNTAFYEKKK